jgi:competence protein ComEC
MGFLDITLIDVGWGDSVLLEHQDDSGTHHYALIDSNDSKNSKSTRMYVDRLFQRKRQDPPPPPLFEFVLLTHAHEDHVKGLEGILREFGAERVLYPKAHDLGSSAKLIDYCERSGRSANPRVRHHQSIDSSKIIPAFGDVQVEVLWPPHDEISSNENDNSVVLRLSYGNASAVLTGDAEKDVWERIEEEIRPDDDTRFFKVPHHGSKNGCLDERGDPVWLDSCPDEAILGISCMYRQDYEHPHDEVLDLFEQRGRAYYRTDENYHLTVSFDGSENPEVKYSRF